MRIRCFWCYDELSDWRCNFFLFPKKRDETGEILGSPLRRRAVACVRAGSYLSCTSEIGEFELEAGYSCNNDEKKLLLIVVSLHFSDKKRRKSR